MLIGLAIAAAVVLSAELARRTPVPAPCYLVVAGLAVSVVPGIESVRLPPQVVFFGFLPPLLYSAAFLTAPREVRANWLSILLLAVGLTAATLFAVAGVAWAAVASLGVGASFLLGAVLGPTDPITATAVISSTSAPERLRTILEAESLVNDGVALVAFSISLTAVEHGGFSVGEGLARFVEVSAGGIAIGLAIAVGVEWARRRVHDAHVEIPLSLLTPYLAYIPAESAHVSGILATVACGVYLGWRSEGIFRPEVRVQSLVFWDILTFILGSILFVLLGMQLRPVLGTLHGDSWQTLTRDAVLVFAVVALVRIAWMFTVPRFVSVLGRGRDWAEIDPWRDRLLLGWSGMRGALSLAAALSIPVSIASRNEILFLTFTTILAGLLVLAIPLPWLLRALGFGRAGASPEERGTRRAIAEAALRRLADIEGEGDVSAEAAGMLRELYEARLRRLDRREDGDSDETETYRRLRRELLAAERAELRRREREGAISFTGARAIERLLDHEETGLR